MSGRRHRPSQDRRVVREPIPAAWQGDTAVLIGGGPSLTAGQVNTVKTAWSFGECRVIGINRAYEIAPWVDALYASDDTFWTNNIDAIRSLNIALLFAYDGPSAEKYGLWHIPGPHPTGGANNVLEGLSDDPRYIYTGAHSGYAALNLAYHLGAARILLLGYDCKYGAGGRKHWHDDHIGANNAADALAWAAHYPSTLAQLRRRQVTVINCTPDTDLDCFPKETITHALRR